MPLGYSLNNAANATSATTANHVNVDGNAVVQGTFKPILGFGGNSSNCSSTTTVSQYSHIVDPNVIPIAGSQPRVTKKAYCVIS